MTSTISKEGGVTMKREHKLIFIFHASFCFILNGKNHLLDENAYKVVFYMTVR